jgi:hypothetical protein
VWHSLLEPLCLFFTSFCPHFKFLRRGFCHLVAVVKAPRRNGVWLQQMQVWFTEASVKGLCWHIYLYKVNLWGVLIIYLSIPIVASWWSQ